MSFRSHCSVIVRHLRDAEAGHSVGGLKVLTASEKFKQKTAKCEIYIYIYMYMYLWIIYIYMNFWGLLNIPIGAMVLVYWPSYLYKTWWFCLGKLDSYSSTMVRIGDICKNIDYSAPFRPLIGRFSGFRGIFHRYLIYHINSYSTFWGFNIDIAIEHDPFTVNLPN